MILSMDLSKESNAIYSIHSKESNSIYSILSKESNTIVSARYGKVLKFIILGLLIWLSSGRIALAEAPESQEMKLPVLLYHHLDGGKKAENATITEERFREQMEFLQEQGFTPLLSQDILEIRDGTQAFPEKPIMITFDDGYASNYERAFHILEKTDMKATIFVIASYMDIKTPNQISKLTWDQMKEMYESGLVDIQSHSYNLHNFDKSGMYHKMGVNGMARGLIETEALYDLRIGADLLKSKELIESKVGNEVIALAYPYGVYDPWCIRPLERTGIKLGFVLGGEMANINNDPFRLKRINVTMQTDLEYELQLLTGMESDNKDQNIAD